MNVFDRHPSFFSRKGHDEYSAPLTLAQRLSYRHWLGCIGVFAAFSVKDVPYHIVPPTVCLGSWDTWGGVSRSLFTRVVDTGTPIKKENQVFLMYREIQSGAVAKSYMTNGLLIYGEIFAHFLKY